MVINLSYLPFVQLRYTSGFRRAITDNPCCSVLEIKFFGKESLFWFPSLSLGKLEINTALWVPNLLLQVEYEPVDVDVGTSRLVILMFSWWANTKIKIIYDLTTSLTSIVGSHQRTYTIWPHIRIRMVRFHGDRPHQIWSPIAFALVEYPRTC